MNSVTWLTSLGLPPDADGREQRLREADRLRNSGRVMSLRTVPGRIEARVQGTHARPHLVELAVGEWTPAQWHAVGDLLARQARHHARLLAGQLPDQFDLALTELGLSLVPATDEWRLRCTCDEPRQPCVHQIAVWLVTLDELDAEPYLLTRLRGRGRDQLLAAIRDQRAPRQRSAMPVGELDATAWSAARVHPSEVPLPAPRTTTPAGGALRMLGEPAVWAGPADAVAMFGPAITAAAARAHALLARDRDHADRPV